MKVYQKPWWVLIIQLPTLDTILEEDHHTEQKRFVLTGKPVLKSLTWVTYGPAFALVAVMIMGLLAWGLEVKAQPISTKVLVGCGMVLLPGLFWLGGSGVMNRLMHKPLHQQIQAGRKQVELTLDLNLKSLQVNQESPILFKDIITFKLVTDSGLHYEPQAEINALLNLVLETNQGPVTLLVKELGTTQQKLQLMSQLQEIISNS